MTMGGNKKGHRAPSSEWRFHRDIYATRPEAGAVVHTHSAFATTLACLGRAIPAFHYEVAFAGGNDIRCAQYKTFGTQELSDVALAALEGRRACLLAHHGVIAFGADLDDALRLADKVEALARLYWQAIQVEEPTILDDVEMARIVERFRHYGPAASRAARRRRAPPPCRSGCPGPCAAWRRPSPSPLPRAGRVRRRSS